MQDPVHVLLALIKERKISSLEKVKVDMKPLFNRRNVSIFIHALLDLSARAEGCDNASQKDGVGAIWSFFSGAGLPINEPLASGELPINLLICKAPKMAAEIITSNPKLWNVNLVDQKGFTPLMHAVDVAKSAPRNGLAVVIALLNCPELNLQERDQGAYAAFKGLHGLAIWSGTEGGCHSKLSAVALVEALARKYYDFNAARGMSDTVFGSQINTPMAYCIKKTAQWMQWNHSAAKRQGVGESLFAVVRALIRAGADPSLQMEPGHRIELMDLCSQVGFPAGLTQALEAGVIGVEIGAQKKRVGRSSRL